MTKNPFFPLIIIIILVIWLLLFLEFCENSFITLSFLSGRGRRWFWSSLLESFIKVCVFYLNYMHEDLSTKSTFWIYRTLERISRLCPNLQRIKVLMDDLNYRQFERFNSINQVKILIQKWWYLVSKLLHFTYIYVIKLRWTKSSINQGIFLSMPLIHINLS